MQERTECILCTKHIRGRGRWDFLLECSFLANQSMQTQAIKTIECMSCIFACLYLHFLPLPPFYGAISDMQCISFADHILQAGNMHCRMYETINDAHMSRPLMRSNINGDTDFGLVIPRTALVYITFDHMLMRSIKIINKLLNVLKPPPLCNGSESGLMKQT